MRMDTVCAIEDTWKYPFHSTRYTYWRFGCLWAVSPCDTFLLSANGLPIIDFEITVQI